MDDLDDMFDSIINKPQKPQPKKAEASFLESQEKKDDEILNTPCKEPALQYRRIRKVPYLKRWPKCGMCQTRLLGNRFGWFAEDEDGNHWWWCVPCLEKVNCFATEKEINRAQKER